MDRVECKHNHGVGCVDPSKCATCGWNLEEAQRRVRAQEEAQAAIGRRAQVTTYFDKITASPEALAEFLAPIPALETPWDELFQRIYCAACSAENCDAENCPHQAERNSPAWFLAQEVVDDGNDPLR